MAFKTFYCVLLLFCGLFAVVKGSCLEYGHSCWGAHGKRSASFNDLKPATEVDFADINAMKEVPFYTTEEHLNGPNRKALGNPNASADEINDDFSPKGLKLRKMFLKHFNKHRMNDMTAEENDAARRTQDVVDSLVDNSWRRLPIWYGKRYQVNSNNWLNNLEREQQRQHLSGDNIDDY